MIANLNIPKFWLLSSMIFASNVQWRAARLQSRGYFHSHVRAFQRYDRSVIMMFLWYGVCNKKKFTVESKSVTNWPGRVVFWRLIWQTGEKIRGLNLTWFVCCFQDCRVKLMKIFYFFYKFLNWAWEPLDIFKIWLF